MAQFGTSNFYGSGPRHGKAAARQRGKGDCFMPVPVPDPENALQLYQRTLEVLGYVLLGAALIAIGVYVLLVSSEFMADKVWSKGTRRRRFGSVVEQSTRDVSATGTGFPDPAREDILHMPAPQPSVDAVRAASVRKRA